MSNELERELKELQIQYDKVLEERNELNKNYKKLKKIVKENFRVSGSPYSKVHYLYTIPRMQDDILAVLKDE